MFTTADRRMVVTMLAEGHPVWFVAAQARRHSRDVEAVALTQRTRRVSGGRRSASPRRRRDGYVYGDLLAEPGTGGPLQVVAAPELAGSYQFGRFARQQPHLLVGQRDDLGAVRGLQLDVAPSPVDPRQPAAHPAGRQPRGGRNGVPSSRAIVRSTASSIARSTGWSSDGARHAARTCWPTPSPRPAGRAAEHHGGGFRTTGRAATGPARRATSAASSMTTAIPTWLTGPLVVTRIARSAALSPRNSHRSPKVQVDHVGEADPRLRHICSLGKCACGRW